MKRNLIVALTIALAVVLTGCDSSTDARRAPLAPTLDETSQQLRIFGVVADAGGVPIAGARVSALPEGGPGVDTASDAQGAYAMEVERSAYFVISAEREGFEPSKTLLNPFGREMRRDVRMLRIVRINVGESVTVTVALADPGCGDGDRTWSCRRVRVAAARDGQLRLAVPAASSDPIFLLRVADNWDINPSPSIAVPVAAGSETIVELLLEGPPPQTALLNTGWGQ